MIKFFRKIRQKLLTENRFNKYILYAIGEITLVMIGILLALQVNNWNEKRIAKTNEVKTLQQLNIDLKTNLKELKSISSYVIYSKSGMSNILEGLNNGFESIDSLRVWVEQSNGGNIFNNANTAYKNIENNDKSIISNDSLRIRITLMYERHFFNVKSRERISAELFKPRYKTELLRSFKVGKRTKTTENASIWAVNTPIDINLLRKNVLYKNALVELLNFNILRIRRLKDTIKELELLIQDIDSEIKRLI